MHKLALGATLALASFAVAQSPLNTLYARNNGGAVGGAVYFDLTVNTPIEFTQVDLSVGQALGIAGGVDVYIHCNATSYVGTHLGIGNWIQVASGVGTSAGLNLATPCPLNTPFSLLPGSYVVALVGVSFSHQYTNGTGSNQNYAATECSLFLGGASNVPFTGGQFNPRVWNGGLHFTTAITQPPLIRTCAEANNYGAGCYLTASSFYEQFTNLAAFDLSGGVGTENTILLTSIGPAGYLVSQGASAWFAPTGTPVLNNSAVPGAMGDDTTSQALNLPFTFNHKTGNTTVVHANTNGYLVLGATTATGGDFSPTVAELLSFSFGNSGTARLAPCWADLHAGRNLTTNPNSGVYFDIDPSGNTAYVTWLEVGEFANSTAGASLNTLQVALHSNGDVEFRYGQMDRTAGTSGCIAGWSHGNSAGPNAIDPGSRDISAAIPFSTNGPDGLPLALNADARPVLGSTFNLVTSDIPATAILSSNILSFTQVSPAVELSGIGMPNCFQHVGLAGSSALVSFANPSFSRSLTVPTHPSWIGATLFAQSASLVPGVNPLGALSSNGVELVLGTQ